MELSFWIVVCNTVLFTLIWLVQLIIYPSFLEYNELEIKTWHPRYTRLASLITAPLMFLQLILYGVLLSSAPALITFMALGLIAIAWLVTFLVAIPLHSAIDRENETIAARQKLVRVNWLRTIAWTGSFLLSLFEYGK